MLGPIEIVPSVTLSQRISGFTRSCQSHHSGCQRGQKTTTQEGLLHLYLTHPTLSISILSINLDHVGIEPSTSLIATMTSEVTEQLAVVGTGAGVDSDL